MWDPEHFPGADHVPWQLLIRARFVYELDAVIASHVVHALGQVLPAKAVAEFAHLATRVVAASPHDKVGQESAFAALSAYADFDDWCGTKWPRWPFPWPGPRRFDDLVDPIAITTLAHAKEVVSAAGSPELQKGLDSALDELAGSLGR